MRPTSWRFCFQKNNALLVDIESKNQLDNSFFVQLSFTTYFREAPNASRTLHWFTRSPRHPKETSDAGPVRPLRKALTALDAPTFLSAEFVRSRITPSKKN